MVAEDARGNRRRFVLGVGFAENAERMAAALNVRLASGRLPVGFAAWPVDRASYGSLAWEEYGNDDELALERREAEEEAFSQTGEQA